MDRIAMSATTTDDPTVRGPRPRRRSSHLLRDRLHGRPDRLAVARRGELRRPVHRLLHRPRARSRPRRRDRRPRGRVPARLPGHDAAPATRWRRSVATSSRRGLFFRPGHRRSPVAVGRRHRSREAIHGDSRRRRSSDARWPAHLHIDFLRRRPWTRPRSDDDDAGGSTRSATEGIPGCHLGTWAENSDAIAFFEAMGLRRRGRNPAHARREEPDGRTDTTVRRWSST